MSAKAGRHPRHRGGPRHGACDPRHLLDRRAPGRRRASARSTARSRVTRAASGSSTPSTARATTPSTSRCGRRSSPSSSMACRGVGAASQPAIGRSWWGAASLGAWTNDPGWHPSAPVRAIHRPPRRGERELPEHRAVRMRPVTSTIWTASAAPSGATAATAMPGRTCCWRRGDSSSSPSSASRSTTSPPTCRSSPRSAAALTAFDGPDTIAATLHTGDQRHPPRADPRSSAVSPDPFPHATDVPS